jgi:sulfite dehydrogenase (cytochrome) subunit A
LLLIGEWREDIIVVNRRSLLGGFRDALAGAALTKIGLPLTAYAEETTNLPFANGERPLTRYPGKRPLIRLTSRPPQLETPFSVFNEGVITPNDAFFVVTIWPASRF